MSMDCKTLVRRWFEEVWNQKRDASIDELMAADGVFHGLGPDPVHGPDNFRLFRGAFLDALPDINVHIDEVIEEDCIGAVRYTCTATHKGAGLGFPATNRPVTFTGMAFVRIEGGKAAEAWNNFDQFSLFKQIGAIQPT